MTNNINDLNIKRLELLKNLSNIYYNKNNPFFKQYKKDYYLTIKKMNDIFIDDLNNLKNEFKLYKKNNMLYYKINEKKKHL